MTVAERENGVSCLCLTYGRPHLLEEAIESFLRQDWNGPRELVVLNDHPRVAHPSLLGWVAGATKNPALNLAVTVSAGVAGGDSKKVAKRHHVGGGGGGNDQDLK